MEVTHKKRNRNPMSEATKQAIRLAMLRIGHRPPLQKGVTRSEETRRRISVVKRGHSHSVATRQKMSNSRTGEGNHFFGRSHTDHSRRLMSVAKIGKKPPNWIPDRTKLKFDPTRGGQQHSEWSMSVKGRDNWKCQLSDKNCSGRIEAHHIYSWNEFPELRYQLSNGISLCHAHHPRRRDDERRMIPIFIKMVSNTVN